MRLVLLIARRVSEALIAIIAVSVIVTGLLRLSGDPVTLIAPPEATESELDAIRDSLGLNDPLPVQVAIFLGNMVQGDLGTSIKYRLPVVDLYVDRLPVTMELGLVAFSLACLAGLSVGVFAAYKPRTPIDYIGRSVAALGQSLPAFVVGLMLILIFAVHLDVLPASGAGSVSQLILPAVTLSWFSAAGMMRLTRSSMMEVLSSDYVLLARLKGMPERVVLWTHGFKNALLPVLTFGALLLINMITGTVIVETVFNWPGMGLLMIDGIRARDLPLVQGGVVILTVAYILANLLVDVLYVALNPQLRKEI